MMKALPREKKKKTSLGHHWGVKQNRPLLRALQLAFLAGSLTPSAQAQVAWPLPLENGAMAPVAESCQMC